MFPTRKPILTLHLGGNVIHTTADHSFFTSNGWVNAGDLQAGDLLRAHDGTWATVQAVEIDDQQPIHQPALGFMPYPATGPLPAGTLVPTTAGLKKIEDIEIGDFIMVPSPDRN